MTLRRPTRPSGETVPYTPPADRITESFGKRCAADVVQKQAHSKNNADTLLDFDIRIASVFCQVIFQNHRERPAANSLRWAQLTMTSAPTKVLISLMAYVFPSATSEDKIPEVKMAVRT